MIVEGDSPMSNVSLCSVQQMDLRPDSPPTPPSAA